MNVTVSMELSQQGQLVDEIIQYYNDGGEFADEDGNITSKGISASRRGNHLLCTLRLNDRGRRIIEEMMQIPKGTSEEIDFLSAQEEMRQTMGAAFGTSSLELMKRKKGNGVTDGS